MKKSFFFILLISHSSIFSQTFQSSDSLIIKELIEQIKTLKASNTQISQELLQKVNVLTSNNETNTQTVKTLLSGREYDSKTKYEIINQNLINAVETFELLSSKTVNLKSRNASNSFELLIKELNNPQSDALGFKFNETLLSLVNLHIQPKKKNKGKKILEAIEGIIKSPIVTNIPTLTPAVSISNSVIGILRSTSIFEEKVDNEKIKNFEVDLNRYIQYYTALSDANQAFKFNLEHQKDELGILQQNIYEQVVFFAKTLKYPVQPKGPNEDIGEYLNNLFKDFNRTSIEQQFTTLETQYTDVTTDGKKIKYDDLLKKEPYLKDANNRLEEFIVLTNQFEFKYNEYFDILEQYTNGVTKALDTAQSNGIATSEIVTKKKEEFEKKKVEAVGGIKTSINISQLKISKQKINYTARII